MRYPIIFPSGLIVIFAKLYTYLFSDGKSEMINRKSFNPRPLLSNVQSTVHPVSQLVGNGLVINQVLPQKLLKLANPKFF